jgi:hypothetical protein
MVAGEIIRIQKERHAPAGGLADVLMKLGRYAEALRQARSARRVLTNAGPVHLAQLETHVGNVY